MREIRAVVIDPAAPSRLALVNVEAPVPLPNEAVVRVGAVSLNRGEVRRCRTAAAGWRPGWDIAGTVIQAAQSGAGPKVGARVVGLLPAGAWAEEVAVAADALAELPEGVTLEQAATLPVAGLTAYHALRHGGLLLEQNVLVTGATGGVGDFALQMARLSGARVTAHIRRPEQERQVREAGADRVVIGETPTADPAHKYHLIVDSVAGPVLGAAMAQLDAGGTCVTFGITGGVEVTFDNSQFYMTGCGMLYGLFLFEELKRTESASRGLARLAALVAAGKLKPQISVTASWTRIGEVAQQLSDRKYSGKAVLRVTE